jgi:hypothetical protein
MPIAVAAVVNGPCEPAFLGAMTDPAAQNSALETPPVTAEELDAGLVALQDWLIELRRAKLVEIDEAGILFIHANVARRFALAFVHDAVLLAMPPLETVWARIVPWSYAAIYRGRNTLHLVGETMVIDDAPAPPLAISFTVTSVNKALALQQHDELELRGFAGNLSGQWQVSPRAFARMPLHILDEDENVMDLMERRAKASARVGR